MIDVLTGTLVACGFMLAGFLYSDWQRRAASFKAAEDMMGAATALVGEYKAHLARLHEIDLTRAQKMVEFQTRLETIETRHEMAKVERK